MNERQMKSLVVIAGERYYNTFSGVFPASKTFFFAENVKHPPRLADMGKLKLSVDKHRGKTKKRADKKSRIWPYHGRHKHVNTVKPL